MSQAEATLRSIMEISNGGQLPTLLEMKQKRMDLLAHLTKGFTKEEASGLTKMFAKADKLTLEEIHEYPSSPFYFYPFGSNIERGSSQHSKKLYQLTRELTCFKNHLVEHYCQPSWLGSVEEVISLITCYREDTRELPFHWAKRRFLAERHRGAKLEFPPGLSIAQLSCTLPKIKHEKEYDEEDECDGCLRHTWWTPYRLGRHNTITISHPLISNDVGIYSEFMDGHDKQIWQEFKELNKGLREDERKFVEVDHPIVSVIGNFVVAAFNNECKKHVLNRRLNDVYGFQFMGCIFIKVRDAYVFKMIIEVTQERECGTYMAEVDYSTCDDRCVLYKFFLTNDKPIDTEKLAASYLSCLESICKAVDDLSKEKIKRLSALYKGLGGCSFPEGCTAGGELSTLKQVYGLTKKGLCSRLEEDRSRQQQSVINSGLKQASSSKGTKLCTQASLSKEKTFQGKDSFTLADKVKESLADPSKFAVAAPVAAASSAAAPAAAAAEETKDESDEESDDDMVMSFYDD